MVKHYAGNIPDRPLHPLTQEEQRKKEPNGLQEDRPQTDCRESATAIHLVLGPYCCIGFGLLRSLKVSYWYFLLADK